MATKITVWPENLVTIRPISIDIVIVTVDKTAYVCNYAAIKNNCLELHPFNIELDENDKRYILSYIVSPSRIVFMVNDSTDQVLNVQ